MFKFKCYFSNVCFAQFSPLIHFPLHCTFESRERKIMSFFIKEYFREYASKFSPIFTRKFSNNRTSRVSEPHHFCDLIKGFSGRVIKRLPYLLSFKHTLPEIELIMPTRHCQTDGWKRDIIGLPTDKICEHMCLDMVYRDIWNSQSGRKSFCNAYTHKERWHESGKLSTCDDVHLLQGHVCFTKDFFQYSKYIIGMESRCHLWHHPLRLIVFPNLRSGFHCNKSSITKYRNRGIVTGGFKGKKEHGCLIIEIFCL